MEQKGSFEQPAVDSFDDVQILGSTPAVETAFGGGSQLPEFVSQYSAPQVDSFDENTILGDAPATGAHLLQGSQKEFHHA